MNLVPGLIKAIIDNTDLGTLTVNGGDTVNPSVRLESFPPGMTGDLVLTIAPGAAKDAAGNETENIAALWSIHATQTAPRAEPGKLGIQGSILSLFGTEAVIYLLEVTTNFVDWELVSKLKATGNETALTVDLDISHGTGFYRVRTVEP